MIQQDQGTQDRFRPETSRGHNLLEVFGILCFMLLLLSIAVEVYQGMVNFGDLCLAAYLTTSSKSGRTWKPHRPSSDGRRGGA